MGVLKARARDHPHSSLSLPDRAGYRREELNHQNVDSSVMPLTFFCCNPSSISCEQAGGADATASSFWHARPREYPLLYSGLSVGGKAKWRHIFTWKLQTLLEK